ncbi:MAG: hypothetical protein AAFS10_25705, partial [Myxococcota bacterium]
HVEQLVRTRYADVDLSDPTLGGAPMAAGQARRLGHDEVKTLYARVGLEPIRAWVEVRWCGAVV